MSIYNFRIAKNSNWGIFIIVDGEVREINSEKELSNQAIRLADKIWIELPNWPLFNEKKVRDLVLNGLKWIKSDIEIACRTNNSTLIIFNNFIINPTDFQEEGLFFAVASWASMELEFSLPKFEFFFDKGSNKYIFPLLVET